MDLRIVLQTWPAGMLLTLVGCTVSLSHDDAATESRPSTDTAFVEHLAKVRKQAPNGFTVVEQPPFVVIGDESPEMVRQRAADTVKWAVDKLKQDYFSRDPQEIIDIWLFRDEASYTAHAKRLFNDTPSTPFGYYSSEHHALIMNIATGGGTLVHEIVHPYMHANFPECPAWFNEGLASLYEGCNEKNGHIRGLTNWRLPSLKDAIRDGKTLSFEKLTATSNDEFYGIARDASNYSEYYAQARYLCYYLQENGLLTTFYREYVANAKTDPTGYNTLKRVLAEEDMTAFQAKWERYVLGLHFPE